MRLTKAMKLEIVKAMGATAEKNMARLRRDFCLFCRLSEGDCAFCKRNIMAHLGCDYCLDYMPPGITVSLSDAMYARSGKRLWVAAMRGHLLDVALKLRKKWGLGE